MFSTGSITLQERNKTKSSFVSSLLFRFCISVVAILIALIVSFNTQDLLGNKYLFLLPLLYGVLFFLMPSLWNHSKGNVGMTILNLVLFMRYVVSPLFRSLSINEPNIRGKVPTDTGLNYGMFMMIAELLVVFFVVELFAEKFYREKNKTRTLFRPLNNKFILTMVLFLGISLLLIFPELRERYNFFIVTEAIENLTLDIPLDGIILMITDLVFIIFPVIMIDFFKKKYEKIPHFKYVVFSLLSMLPVITFFKGTSRFSVVVPTIAFMVILLKLYPEYKKRLGVIIGSVLLIVFSSFSLYKQFGYTQGSDIDMSMNTNEIAYNLDAYMSGPDNMGRVIDLNNAYGSNITLETLKNDIFNNVALLSGLSDSRNTTSAWFNMFLYENNEATDQIVPLSGQSFLHFGSLGMPILMIITIMLMMFFDSKIKYENRIEYVYLYVYIVMYMSMAMMVSFNSIYPIFTNLFIPILVIFAMNRKLSLRKKNDRSG